MVVATGELGELGITPRHAPLITRLRPGHIDVVLAGGERQQFYVSGGILEVQPQVVTILADTVTRAADLDETAAQARQARGLKTPWPSAPMRSTLPKLKPSWRKLWPSFRRWSGCVRTSSIKRSVFPNKKRRPCAGVFMCAIIKPSATDSA